MRDFADTGCGSERSVADVAAIGDPNTGVDVYDSTPEGKGAPTGWGVWGGTSVASPIVAAEWGLAGGSHGVAFPAATLYSHLGDAGALYDVVSGSNGSCGAATFCQAAAGYDGPTGVGSPIGLGAFSEAGSPRTPRAAVDLGDRRTGADAGRDGGLVDEQPHRRPPRSGSAATPRAGTARRSRARPVRATR